MNWPGWCRSVCSADKINQQSVTAVTNQIRNRGYTFNEQRENSKLEMDGGRET
jgi:hypothetical protein